MEKFLFLKYKWNIKLNVFVDYNKRKVTFLFIDNWAGINSSDTFTKKLLKEENLWWLWRWEHIISDRSKKFKIILKKEWSVSKIIFDI